MENYNKQTLRSVLLIVHTEDNNNNNNNNAHITFCCVDNVNIGYYDNNNNIMVPILLIRLTATMSAVEG